MYIHEYIDSCWTVLVGWRGCIPRSCPSKLKCGVAALRPHTFTVRSRDADATRATPYNNII